MKLHWTKFLALTALLPFLATPLTHALRIRDRSAEVTPSSDSSSGQYLRERVIPAISSTPSPTNQLLNYYAQSQLAHSNPKTVILVSSTTPAPLYTSLVEETEGDEDYSGSIEISAETTTYRIPKVIPASLRRNHGRGPTSTEETATELPEPPPEKPLRKKKKKNGTRRRKVKRPIPQRLEQQQQQPIEEEPKKEEDLGTAANPEKEGDKNLALEIISNDGKYALIDNFFNQTEVRRPGVVSYAQSEDFPRDNQQSLGNLQENEIWLSDGHLLVLKGGEFDATNREKWPPIDDYQRDRKKPPLRIPLDTNNPPPFPVFVNKSGPPIFLVEPPPFLPYPPGFFGNDSNFDPSQFPPPGMIPFNPNGTLPNLPFPPPNGPQGPFGPPGGGLYGNGPPEGNYGGVKPGGNKGRPGPYGGPPGGFPPPGGVYGNKGNSSFPPGPPFPFPPPNFNGSFPPGFGPPPPGFNPNFNGSGPPPNFPIFPPLVLNPADNETDDPSVFLPPPYDFDYYEDNSTIVPPGPFAPGLVVPPPKDFYTVYNRTGRPPSRQPTPRPGLYLPPTHAQDTAPSFPGPPKKQRPNGKKPKFPMTNPPDDSQEELYHHTTPVPDPVYTTTKKRKQRPKKPFFPLEGPGDYPNQGKSIESQEVTELPPRRPPSIIFPEKRPNASPRPNYIQNTYTTDIVPTYKTPSFRTTTKTTTTTSTTTPKSINNFVYIRGQLKSLAEIAAEQGEEEEVDPDRPTTPRPPFDSRGYPTRVLDQEHIVLDYEKTPPPRPKVNRKPTQPPLKTYYTGTPKYEPTYVPYPDNGRIQNSNVPYSPSPSPAPVLNRKRPSQAPPSSRPTVLYQAQAPVFVQQKQRGRNQNNQPSQPYQPQNDYYGNVNQYPQVGPTYATGTGHEVQHPPTSQITFVPQQPQNYRPLDPGPTFSSADGFRPAFPPPQKPRNTKGRSRLLFPGQGQQPQQQQPQQQQQQHQPVQQHQQYNPEGQVSYYNNNGHGQQNQQAPKQKPTQLTNFAPNGYYSPISNFYQPSHPSPTPQVSYQQFIPINPSAAPQHAQGNYNYPAPIYASNPTVPSYNFQGGIVNPLQYYQPGQSYQQQPQQQQQQFAQPQYTPHNQQQYHNQHFNPANQGFNSGLKQYSQPLYDDIAVNYREPLPQYNAESESVTSRSVVRAGPQSPHEKLQSTSAPGTFYSFQRGGPGGFSYKIQL